MSRLQAVFWDVDGTLADTELNGHRVAFNRAFSDCGLAWNWDENLYSELLCIPGGQQRMKFYAKQQGLTLDAPLLERLRGFKQQHYLNIIASGAVQLRPGVRRLLKELNTADVQQWIVTSSGESSVHALLKSFPSELNDMFQGIVTANDVDKHKPNPDPYQLALSRSGCDPEAVVALEDSSQGLRAAFAAGLRCLLTPSPWDSDLEQCRHHAHAITDHLGDLDQASTIFDGPPCIQGWITLEYLQLLLRVPLR